MGTEHSLAQNTDSSTDRNQDDTRGTRISQMEPDLFDQSTPRLGRRESEPHSAELRIFLMFYRIYFP